MSIETAEEIAEKLAMYDVTINLDTDAIELLTEFIAVLTDKVIALEKANEQS